MSLFLMWPPWKQCKASSITNRDSESLRNTSEEVVWNENRPERGSLFSGICRSSGTEENLRHISNQSLPQVFRKIWVGLSGLTHLMSVISRWIFLVWHHDCRSASTCQITRTHAGVDTHQSQRFWLKNGHDSIFPTHKIFFGGVGVAWWRISTNCWGIFRFLNISATCRGVCDRIFSADDIPPQPFSTHFLTFLSFKFHLENLRTDNIFSADKSVCKTALSVKLLYENYTRTEEVLTSLKMAFLSFEKSFPYDVTNTFIVSQLEAIAVWQFTHSAFLKSWESLTTSWKKVWRGVVRNRQSMKHCCWFCKSWNKIWIQSTSIRVPHSQGTKLVSFSLPSPLCRDSQLDSNPKHQQNRRGGGRFKMCDN